jgi:hypothetical protein
MKEQARAAHDLARTWTADPYRSPAPSARHTRQLATLPPV